jgi:CRISPR/Cas system-associated exonuclease Cas4 (RecB family)
MSQLYLSYYKLSQYRTCPAKISFSELRLPRVDSRNAFEGSVIHMIAEDYLKGDLASLSAAFGLLPSYFQKFLAENPVIYRGDPKKDLADIRKRVMRSLSMLIDYFDRYNITPQNSDSEVTCSFEFNGLKLAGRVDIIQRLNDGIYVWDVKDTTSKRYISKDQLYFYLMLVSGDLNVDFPKQAGFIFTHLDDVDLIHPNRSYILSLWTECYDAALAIHEENLPYRLGPHCRYCDYRNLCPKLADFGGKPPKFNYPPSEGLVVLDSWK